MFVFIMMNYLPPGSRQLRAALLSHTGPVYSSGFFCQLQADFFARWVDVDCSSQVSCLKKSPAQLFLSPEFLACWCYQIHS